jgi:hypothetical protein
MRIVYVSKMARVERRFHLIQIRKHFSMQCRGYQFPINHIIWPVRTKRRVAVAVYRLPQSGIKNHERLRRCTRSRPPPAVERRTDEEVTDFSTTDHQYGRVVHILYDLKHQFPECLFGPARTRRKTPRSGCADGRDITVGMGSTLSVYDQSGDERIRLIPVASAIIVSLRRRPRGMLAHVRWRLQAEPARSSSRASLIPGPQP